MSAETVVCPRLIPFMLSEKEFHASFKGTCTGLGNRFSPVCE